MKKYKKGKFFCISLLALVASFSGAEEGGITGFSYRFGPAICEESILVHTEYTDRDFPNYQLTVRLYTEKNGTLLYEGITISGKLTDNHPVFVHDETLPEYYTSSYDSLYLEITFRNKSDWLWIDYYNNKVGWDIYEIGDTISAVNPEINEVLDTKRWLVYKNAEDNKARLERDSYYVGRWKIYSESAKYHGIRIQNFILGFHGGTLGTNTLSGLANLYIFSHPTEWTIGTQTTIEKKRAVCIPLRFTPFSTYVDSSTDFVYQLYNVETAETYAVSKQDYRMSLDPPNETDYFYSNDVFIPVRNGLESETFSCMMRFSNLTRYYDNIKLDFTVNKGTTLFGNCEDADYCVTLGEGFGL